MRTKITIIFETHGMGSGEKHNDWNNDLIEQIADILELPDGDEYKRDLYSLVTYEFVSVEKLEEEPPE